MIELIHLQQLSELADEFASGQESLRDARLLVPSEAISSFRVDVSEIPKRYLAQAIPALLEDRIVEDLNQLHLAWGEPDHDKQLNIFAVKKQTVQEWLDSAAVCGIRAVALYPDFFALPVPEANLPVAVLDTYTVVRFSAHQGFSGNIDDVLAMISHTAPQLSLTLWTDGSISHDSLPNVEEEHPLPDEEILYGSAVNLLQGEFAIRQSRAGDTSLRWPWKLAVAALLFAVGLGFNSWAQTRYLQQQVALLLSVNQRGAQQLLGGRANENWWQAGQYQQAIGQAFLAGERTSNWTLLATINEVLGNCPGCRVEEITIDNGLASLTLTLAGSENLLSLLKGGRLQLLDNSVRENVRILRLGLGQGES